MATTTSTKLATVFTTSGGTTSWSLNHVDPEAESSDIYTFANSVVTNGDIFASVPTGIKSVKLVTTTSTDVEENPA